MADKRQSSYTIRTSDDLDHLLLCENPDPAGDQSLPQRPTERVPVTDFVNYLSPAVTSSVTAVRGTIVACQAAGPITVTAPANAVEGDSFGVMFMNDQPVTIDGNGYQVQVPLPSTMRFVAAPLQFADLEGSVFGWTLADPDQTGLRWMWSGSVNEAPVTELWTVPVDSNADLAGGPLPLTFSGTSRLFTHAGGVLTSLYNVPMSIQIQAQAWITLTGNNNSARVLLEPTTNALNAVTPRMWASQGASRAEAFPNTISGTSFADFEIGDTFQLNSTLTNMAGANLAQYGDSLSGDLIGIFVEFRV